jgi:hypothetical protein
MLLSHITAGHSVLLQPVTHARQAFAVCCSQLKLTFGHSAVHSIAISQVKVCNFQPVGRAGAVAAAAGNSSVISMTTDKC